VGNKNQKDYVGSFWYPLVAFGDAWRLCSGGVGETSFRKDALLSGIDRYLASIVVVSSISVRS
jgi:hypothetical protein